MCLGLEENEPSEVGLSAPVDSDSLATYDHLLFSALSSLAKVLSHCGHAFTETKHTTLLKEIFGE